MNIYKVLFQNGDSLVSSMNATLEEATDYYLNNWFNFGDTEEFPYDIMIQGISVEEIF